MRQLRVLYVLPLLWLAGCSNQAEDPYGDKAIEEDKMHQALEESVNKAISPPQQSSDGTNAETN